MKVLIKISIYHMCIKAHNTVGSHWSGFTYECFQVNLSAIVGSHCCLRIERFVQYIAAENVIMSEGDLIIDINYLLKGCIHGL